MDDPQCLALRLLPSSYPSPCQCSVHGHLVLLGVINMALMHLDPRHKINV